MIKIKEQEFEKLSNYIKINYGINLGKRKTTLVNGRLSNTIEKKGFKNYSEYYDYLLEDRNGKAAYELINKITTNYTFFMRESEHFRFFMERILPFLKSTVKDKDLRVWSAGCSTGEEPYTLAMIMYDFFGKEKLYWNTDILATDISTKVLNEAISGIYSSEKIKALPHRWKVNYFDSLGNEKYIVSDKVKKTLILRKFNLMEKKFPFKRKFHVIFCRNVMIYFDEPTKLKLIEKFYMCLEKGGYLFIGHSETIGRENTKFRYIQPAVYRKD